MSKKKIFIKEIEKVFKDHTHTHTRIRARAGARASHCHSNTRRRAAHTPVHTHALSPRHTHLQAKTPEQHTRTRGSSWFSHIQSWVSGWDPRKCQHVGHIYAHLDTQGQGKTKIIEVERGGKMGKRPIEHIQSTYTHQGHTYQHTHHTWGSDRLTLHTWSTDTHNTHQGHRHP